GARDLIQAVDLGENLIDVVVQHAIEVHARVGTRATQVLDAEPDGRERVLDLVRDLARHLAPGKHALRSSELGNVVQRHDGAAAGEPRDRTAKLMAAGGKLRMLLLGTVHEKTLNDGREGRRGARGKRR